MIVWFNQSQGLEPGGGQGWGYGEGLRSRETIWYSHKWYDLYLFFF